MKMRPFLGVVMTVLLMAAWANAGSLYSWSSGEVLTASQINSNFAHIHNNMVGGHGARLVDADVSGSAAISRSKIANYGTLPVAFVKFSGGTGGTACTSSNCAENEAVNVTTVTRTDGGVYEIAHSTMGDTEYGVHINAIGGANFCWVNVLSATVTGITCNDASGAAADTAATVTFYDYN